MWDLIEHYFTAFNLNHVDREINKLADSLAISASSFKVPLGTKTSYDIQIKHRPYIPDNIKHWQVFEDDREIKKFLECIEYFPEEIIDEEQEIDNKKVMQSYKNSMGGQKIIELKTNHIPKGLVPLERLFNNNDVFLKPDNKSESESTVDCNIGTESQPKFVKVSKFLSKKERDRYVALLKQYVDIFAWSYSNLKTYHQTVIEHKIPFKLDVKPLVQKLRHINPILLPIIEKEIKKMWDAKIILPLRFSNWVANIVSVRKKSGEIQICVDFRNLNRCSLKDNYPLPKMDYVLQKVVGSKRV